MKRHTAYNTTLILAAMLLLCSSAPATAGDGEDGFSPLFNGKDLAGWQGATNAYFVKDGVLISKKETHGDLFTAKEYSNFILRLEFRNEPSGNNGIGLRVPLEGTPAYTGMEIQLLDDEHPNYKDLEPAQFTGSVYGAVAAKRGHVKPAWQWNVMEIVADGPHIKVTLNGAVITDADLSTLGPKEIHGQKLAGLLRPKGYIALSGHNQHTEFRNVQIKELPNSKTVDAAADSPAGDEEGFVSLFDGKTLAGWQGDVQGYAAENGILVCTKQGGRLNTEKEYADFVFRFDFKLEPGSNNGVILRAPPTGDGAYVGMECQILDDPSPLYKDIAPYQHHGSIYGIFPAKPGFLKPAGEWNSEEIVCDGTKIKVTLNGTVIVDGDLETVKDGTMDGKDHPGRFRPSGVLGFGGHGCRVEFRNLRIKELP